MNSTWFGWLTYTGLALSLFWLGMLSRRLGRVTHAPPRYIGLFASAGCVALIPLLQLVDNIFQTNLTGWQGWALIYNGIPALGLTLGVFFAWHYWSWLFAERD